MILIKVAVGVILNDQKNQVFLTKRKSDQDFAGLWEFPGGKVEKNEAVSVALERELKEEIGIIATSIVPFMLQTHSYPHKAVELHCFVVTGYKGDLVPQEEQEGQWVKITDLKALQMPKANQEIVEMFEQYLIKDMPT